MQITIAHLYPNLLNIYGDRGNIISLRQRCLWRGIEVNIKQVSLGDKILPKKFDLFFGGGGQDKQQLIVAKDLQKKAKVLKLEASRGVPMLAICGTYQLFGHYFKTDEGITIPGISIFDAYTVAGNKRKIGNIIIKINPSINYPAFAKATADKQSTINQQSINKQSTINEQTINYQSTINQLLINHNLVGFENHSGNTFIKSSQPPATCNQTKALGVVIKGFGNNGQDKTEGAVYRNVIGTYLHGPILPKNPHLADWLIKTALEVKYKRRIDLTPLDDTLEWQAHKSASKRP